MVLVVLAALLIPIATTAVWATRTMLNTDRFTHTVEGVISDPAVITVTSTRLTNEVFDALLNSQFVQDLPPTIRAVTLLVTGSLRSTVQERVDETLSSEEGQQILTGAVKRAHRTAMRLLEGDGLLSNSALTVANGTVTLDLVSVIRQVLLGLQNDGVIPSSVHIPAEGEPPGALATALGSRLPADFGQVVVYQTDAPKLDGELEQAQRALVILKRAVVLLVILSVLCAIAAVLVAVDRRQGLFRVAVGVTIVTVVLIVVVRRVAARVPKVATTEGAKTVATSLAEALRSSLVRTLLILAIIAIITAVVARTWHALGSLIADHAEVARIAAVALGLLVLVLLGWGWGSVIFAAVVTALGLVAVRLATSAGTPQPT
jgi:hypothetical protein